MTIAANGEFFVVAIVWKLLKSTKLVLMRHLYLKIVFWVLE